MSPCTSPGYDHPMFTYKYHRGQDCLIAIVFPFRLHRRQSLNFPFKMPCNFSKIQIHPRISALGNGNSACPISNPPPSRQRTIPASLYIIIKSLGTTYQGCCISTQHWEAICIDVQFNIEQLHTVPYTITIISCT